MSHLTSKFKSTPTPTFKSRTNSTHPIIKPSQIQIKLIAYRLLALITIHIMILLHILFLRQNFQNKKDQLCLTILTIRIQVREVMSRFQWYKNQASIRNKSSMEDLVSLNLKISLLDPMNILLKHLKKRLLNIALENFKDHWRKSVQPITILHQINMIPNLSPHFRLQCNYLFTQRFSKRQKKAKYIFWKNSRSW